MYINANDLKAENDHLVIVMKHWPNVYADSKLVVPDTATNRYDNGRELYYAEVRSSANAKFSVGDKIVVSIYFGMHVPSKDKTEKIKIIPASGVILKSDKELKVMSDVLKMDPGMDRIIIKLDKKEVKTKGGIYIPDELLKQDPTAQDVRYGEVIASKNKIANVGDRVIIEAFMGTDFYLDNDKNLYVVCYGQDIIAKIDK